MSDLSHPQVANFGGSILAPQKFLETFIFWKYLAFMSTLDEQVAAAGYADRLLTERSLAAILGGGDARRYGLVNRALKDGSLIRLKRGLYTLSNHFRNTPPHPFAIVQGFVPGSYVSLETALAHHGWIPEAVYETASITPGRKSLSYDHNRFGRFAFYPLAIEPYQFLRGVERIKLGDQSALVATPLRALMDLVAQRKEAWRGLDWLTVGLRIDPERLLGLRKKDFTAMKGVHKHKATQLFLDELARAIDGLKPERAKTQRTRGSR